MKKSIILGISALLATPCLAGITVQGIIRDAYTKEPLSGVYVMSFSNSKFSTITEDDGSFSFEVPDYETSLRVRRDGYNVQQVSLANRFDKSVEIELYSDAFRELLSLDAKAQRSLSAQVSDLTSDVSVDNQVGASLGGQIRSINRGGVPGIGAYMLLNGINSLNMNAQPLVVLDGVLLDMQYDRNCTHEGFYNNLLANLSVYDIADVTVLRNGTAIYGAKGSNGVILINTKRSHSYTTKIDVNIAGRYEQTPRLPEMMDASEYRSYVSEMLQTTGTKLSDFRFLREDPKYYYYKIYHNNTDWTKEVYRESFSQQYGINVQGGDDVANYNISLGFAKADAPVKYTDYSRFNLRINTDVKLTNEFKIKLDAAYSDVNRDMRDDGVPASLENNIIYSPTFLSLIKSPFLSPYAYDKQGNLSKFLSDADDYLGEVLPNTKSYSLSNPVGILRDGEARNKNSFGNRMISVRVAPSYNFRHHLTLTDEFSFMMFTTDDGYYVPVFGTPTYKIKNVGSIDNVSMSLSSHQYQTTNDLRLTWNYSKNQHNLNLMGGWRMNFMRYNLSKLSGNNSGNDKLPNLSKNLANRDIDGANIRNANLTYYAQGSYHWASKYYLDLGIALESSSNYGKDAEHALKMFDVAWAFFPSVSASWAVSNEEWFPLTEYVDNLRLNAGFDISGNDNVDPYASRTYFGAKTIFNSIVGTVINGIGNTKMKWESTKRLTYGFESNLWKNRLSVALNAYKSWTSDLVTLQPLAYTIGLDENWCNGGALENTGFDVSFQAKVLNLKDWHWQVGASVGHYKNEITKLPAGTIYNDYCNATIASIVGQPVGVFYGYKTDGVYSTSQEAAAAGKYIVNSNGSRSYFAAGDMNFVDLDDNHVINDNDRTVIGNPNPDIYGNISSHLQWKKLALDVVFNYSLGNDLYNYQRSILESGSQFYNQTKAVRSRWSSEGQKSDIPRVCYEDKMGNSRFSDRWIEDGSYLRLKNVTLSYSWDFTSLYIQGLTVWGSAQNLFTMTKYLGSDPEFSASNNVLHQGIDCGWLPNNRNFSVGVKINL